MRAWPFSGISRGRIRRPSEFVHGSATGGRVAGRRLVGFHIQAHCTNFLQTVDRIVESRIDWEHFSVQRLDHRTTVRPFPISVEFADATANRSRESASRESSYEERGRF